MKVPLSWLKDYLNVNLASAQIAKLFTSLGLEVDAITPINLDCTNVVVGKVTSAEKHPNADKLKIALVSDGLDLFQVVCGAPNCREGLVTAFAKLGSVLHDKDGKEFAVKAAKIRGVESSGMLCSPFELGLSDEHEGIIEFASHLKEGTDVASLYNDTIFDISLTPNLNHCGSIFGAARELSTIVEGQLTPPAVSVNENSSERIESAVKVTIQNQEKCPRYRCRLIKNVKVAASPDWLKARLEACGLRSINNVVDITNYVLLELGHPLHAFDFDLLEGHEIVVRTATEGEQFTTLDEKTRKLTTDDLLICDKNKPVCIAGVMGGLNSEVSFKTTNVLLESAYFQPGSIRRTSKRLGLQTDSSKRFERGTDPNGLQFALDRAAMLIQQVAGGEMAQGTIDACNTTFPELQIPCRLERINMLLGTRLSVNEVEEIFRRLNFHYRWNGQAFEVTVPTFRVDIKEEIDLIEEVARVYGYDNIPKAAAKYCATEMPNTPVFHFEREVREGLVRAGLQEFLNCDLIGPYLLNIVQDSIMDKEATIKVLNPTSIEQSILRTSLLPGLLQVVKSNFDQQNHDISGFEVGRIHFKTGDQYKEQTVAAVILTGKSAPHYWEAKPTDVDFYHLKGIVENLFEALGLVQVSFKPAQQSIFHPGRQAAIFVGDLEVGMMGEIHPAVQRRLDSTQKILFSEFNLHDLIPLRDPVRMMQSIPVYPASERDWTITLKETTPIEQVMQVIKSIPSKLLETFSVKDLFRSDRLGADKKNVTFHFIYRDKEKTLEQPVVEAEHEKIVNEATRLLENF